jgi:MSHA biogenesis protein MshJ
MAARIHPSVQKLITRIDALTLRERVLVFGTAVAVLFSIWQLLFMQPLVQRADQDNKELESLSARIESANDTLEVQVLQLAGAGGEERAQLDGIHARIDLLNEQIGDYAAELIDPAEMAQVLEGMLEKQQNLKLLNMRNLGGEALVVSETPGTAVFYKHGLEIELEGSYLACLDYLEAIEALPWRFYWQVLELNVGDFPTNQIRIEVSTLSMDEEWIGA